MKYRGKIQKIREASQRLESVTQEELRSRSLSLKHVAMCGAPMSKLAEEGFPLVVEAARRCLGITYHDVQLQCGIEMVRGRIAEMKTGEGKTLTASLAGYLFSLYGKGMHLATFNDYLAERDCETNRPLFELLGLRTSFLADGMSEPERAAAYQCDITYGSAKEFGFDFLRDRLKRLSPNAGPPVMRGTQFALVDEADSILIDEARTPLIIGMQDSAEDKITEACFRWAAENCHQFKEGRHFEKRKSSQSAFSLNEEGVRLVRALKQNRATTQVPIQKLNSYIEKALKVKHLFELDKSYAIRDGEIVIIDEFTGRPAEGRQWQDGIHQSVQAKEGLEIAPDTRQAACITIQAFFKRYRTFCGMTGTAWTSKRELAAVYNKRVVRIPTHKPVAREAYLSRVFANQQSKLAAIVESIQQELAGGRAVLVGTRSVVQSEELARVLTEHKLAFSILNAKNLENEADIVAQAGQSPCITVATNMAGRGTDIKLSEQVRQAGGLHVILTELHESARIDWQLIGRGARQGDPGSFQIFVALTDEILSTGYGPTKAKRLAAKYQNFESEDLHHLFPLFRKAQKKAERSNLIDRMIVLKKDQEQKRAAFATGHDPYLTSLGH